MPGITIYLFLLALICGTVSTTDFQSGFLLPQNEGNGSIPFDGNFSINSFVGIWNAVMISGLPSQALCPVVQVSKSLVSTLTISLAYVNTDNYTYVSLKNTYQPSPLNKALLLEVSSLGKKSVAVSYYDDTDGEALLISSDLSFAFGLSKANNSNTNNFDATVNNIFNEINGSLFNPLSYDNTLCQPNFPIASNFNPDIFSGSYYVNAYYMTEYPNEYTCMTADILLKDNLLTLKMFLLKNDGTRANTTDSYVQSPTSEGLFLMDGQNAMTKMTVNYHDSVNNVYFLVSDFVSSPGYYFGFVISNTASLDPAIVSQVQSVLVADGLTVDSSTFHNLESCPSILLVE